MKMKPPITNWLRATCPILLAGLLLGADRPTVEVAIADTTGSRSVEKHTQASVVRDYLAAWHAMGQAMEQNQPELLDAFFVGVAKDKLAETVRAQQNLGIQSAYQEQSHHLQIVFYSPEGLSIQLLDDVEYDLVIGKHGKTLGTQHVRTRYVAVLTPTESKWKVRIFQGGS